MALGIKVQTMEEGLYNLFRGLATVVGVLWLSWLLLRILKSLAVNFNAFFLAPSGITRMNLKKQGPWAVVTGASEGIGRGYALELARQGLNVVIISRSEEKLKKVADEIRDKYSREVRIITADFSLGLEIYPNLAEKLKDFDIGVLVNNVGITTKHPEYLNEIDSGFLHRITEVNSQSMVQMTKLVLPKMLEKKRGVIVNVSSFLGLLNTPMTAVYSASKSFAISFSDSLYKEYSSKGITVQCVVPLIVVTSMTTTMGIDQPTFWTPDPVSYTRAAVATIGIMRFSRGCLSHAFQGMCLDNLIPGFVMDLMFFNTMKQLRANGLELLQKAKED